MSARKIDAVRGIVWSGFGLLVLVAWGLIIALAVF